MKTTKISNPAPADIAGTEAAQFWPYEINVVHDHSRRKDLQGLDALASQDSSLQEAVDVIKDATETIRSGEPSPELQDAIQRLNSAAEAFATGE
ncbi:MAG: hypothetical protein AAF357_14785 [Verrucomicrobiota bacterium]